MVVRSMYASRHALPNRQQDSRPDMIMLEFLNSIVVECRMVLYSQKNQSADSYSKHLNLLRIRVCKVSRYLV